MFTSIWDDLKREFRSGNMVTRIIILNVAIFVGMNLVKILAIIIWGVGNTAFPSFLEFFCLSSDLWFNLTHPWVIFTNMFLHIGVWHILWNMLFLYWFGRIVGDFIGDHRILPLYLLSGLLGGAVYFITSNVGLVNSSYALGASAGVMGIVMASAAISPNYIMRLILLGDVKLKYIVAVLLFLDLLGIANQDNTGGHYAHLGGALFGWFFVYQLRNGNDWSDPVNSVLSRFFAFIKNIGDRLKGKPRRPRVVHKDPGAKSKWKKRWGNSGNASSDSEDLSHQEQIDAILDKIKENGYDSLSKEEKEFLFNASKK